MRPPTRSERGPLPCVQVPRTHFARTEASLLLHQAPHPMLQVESMEKQVVQRLERSYNIDLRVYFNPPLGGSTRAAPVALSPSTSLSPPDPKAPFGGLCEHTGLAVASGLRHLKLEYSAESSVGVIICEPDDITSWVSRRCVATQLEIVLALCWSTALFMLHHYHPASVSNSCLLLRLHQDLHRGPLSSTQESCALCW
jgi:hypothetical protein